jgi:hypothetical protein
MQSCSAGERKGAAVCRDLLLRLGRACPQYTDHCFTGDYPTRLLDRAGEIEPQLSLIAEAS